MEHNTPAPVQPVNPAPAAETMAEGGTTKTIDGEGIPSSFTDDNQRLGTVGMVLLGLTAASLIYSIYYYRKRMQYLEKGENIQIAKNKEDIALIKKKLGMISG